MFRILLRLLFFVLSILAAMPACAGTCSNPAGNEADQIYNQAYHTWQFCNGTNWIPYQAGYSQEQQSAFNPTIPGGSGFFVMSGTHWNGNLGDLTGANSKCYTELTSTNTSWRGYSTASAAGILTAGHIHAFLCDNTGCNNLTASTTYYFAVANNSSAGGASFTTDGSGLGPNDSANWSAANYFAGSYNYWTNMNTSSTTKFSGTTGGNGACNYTWSSALSSATGYYGNSAQTNALRWFDSYTACNNTLNLICAVNP
jgi:hypothetical protein